MTVAELTHGPETPSDADALDASASSCLHIDTRVADVENLVLAGGMFGEDSEDNGWIGIGGVSDPVAFDSGPLEIAEEVADKFVDGLLILVAGNGNGYVARPELIKQFGYGGVWLCEVGEVIAVVFLEFLTNALNSVAGTGIDREGAFNEFCNTVSNHVAVAVERMLRITGLSEGVVGSSTEVVDSVEEGTVEIKYH